MKGEKIIDNQKLFRLHTGQASPRSGHGWQRQSRDTVFPEGRKKKEYAPHAPFFILKQSHKGTMSIENRAPKLCDSNEFKKITSNFPCPPPKKKVCNNRSEHTLRNARTILSKRRDTFWTLEASFMGGNLDNFRVSYPSHVPRAHD
uniref:(northern house mosquito) hypothetical protein n=1 Tax=Culex pipiens TaxID=7175 RepID=A0A8D8JWH7_CULPI